MTKLDSLVYYSLYRSFVLKGKIKVVKAMQGFIDPTKGRFHVAVQLCDLKAQYHGRRLTDEEILKDLATIGMDNAEKLHELKGILGWLDE